MAAETEPAAALNGHDGTGTSTGIGSTGSRKPSRKEKLVQVPETANPQQATCRDNPIAMAVLKKRYLIKDEEGNVIETPEQLFWRVAQHVAQGELNYGASEEQVRHWTHTFYRVMAEGSFLPNTPCLVNAGNPDSTGQLAACFVLGVEDTLEGILETQKNAALIHRTGGGTGFSFSNIRPEGDVVRSTGGVASGPISFMATYDATTNAIKQGGVRRGANMGLLRITHPDVIKFITCKNDLNFLNNFNISVLITEEFMENVKNGGIHQFINPHTGAVTGEMPASELFDLIVESAWNTGEPGIVFEDRINNQKNLLGWQTNTTPHVGKIEATNPCWTGNTKVWTLTGAKTFKELAEAGEDVQVLTQDDSGKLYFEWMRNPRLTRRNVSIVRLTLDDGTVLTCTPDHNLYLKNGEKVQAQDLKPGMSLESTYRYEDAKGYIRLSGKKLVSQECEHRLVARAFYGEIPADCHVHHKDGEKANNSPENLEIIAASAHNSMHMQGKGNPMYGVWDERNPLYGRDVAGSNNPRYREDISNETLRELRAEGKSYKEIAGLVGASKYTVMKRLGWQRRVEVGNHKVISVEALEETADVYNGTVDNTHRYFVMCGDDDAILSANCGEQPLLPYETCNLGSINLNNILVETKDASYNRSNYRIDWRKLQVLSHIGARFLENVVEVNRYPLPQIEEITRKNRRIGLGVMGWADMLFKLRLPYNSEEARNLAEKVMDIIGEAGHEESYRMATERGVFENWIGSDLQDREIVARNCGVTTIAPTGTISIIAGASSGIEPLFALAFWRNQADMKMVEVNDLFKAIGTKEGWLTDEVMAKIAEHGTCKGVAEVPEHWQNVFVTAHDIEPADHLRMQAAWQKYVDAAISKTCNFRHEATREEIRDSYLLAYELGCKGVTVYRDGCRANQVLNLSAPASASDKPQAEVEQEAPEAEASLLPKHVLPVKLPEQLPARRFTVSTPLGSMDLFVTELEGKPVEVFVVLGRSGSDVQAFIEAIGRLTSTLLRSGVPVDVVVNQLRDIGGRSTLGFGINRVVSVPDAIAKTLYRAYVADELNDLIDRIVEGGQPETEAKPEARRNGEICPSCHDATLHYTEGCKKCPCGYSEC